MKIAVHFSGVMTFLSSSKYGALLADRESIGSRRKILLRGVFLCFILLLATVARAEWQAIGSLKAEKPQGNQFTFSSARATVVVTVMASDLVRVRMVSGSTLPLDHSYAVIKTDWPNVKVEFSDEKKTRIIRTSDLEVRIGLSPFRVAFYDRKGQLISKDADTRG